MAFNEKLAGQVRMALTKLPVVEEKKMMGGLTFMVDHKMCIGIMGEELMCRIDPNDYAAALIKAGCRQMDFTGRPMKGFVLVNEKGYRNQEDFNYCIKLSLTYNKIAKPSKKRLKTKPKQ